MKIKLAIAGAIIGCQLFALAACARGDADKRIDGLLLAPLGQIAQMDGASVPNGLPYVPPEERQADSGAPFERKAGSPRGRHVGAHKRGGKHRKKLSSTHRRSQTAAAQTDDQGSCCAQAPAQM